MAFLASTLTVVAKATDTRVIGFSAQAFATLDRTYSFSFTAGVGASQANTTYAATRVFGGSPDVIDLTGALTDAFGATIANARIKKFVLFNSGTASLAIDTTITHGWTTGLNGTVTLPPGGLLVLVAPDAPGWAVTAGTGDLVQVSGTSGQGYEIFVIGGAT